MKGIPTIYRDRQYRSRLEARWAAFFDLVGWPYEYEPFDLDGWIPDFLLKGYREDILVEVKPVTRFPGEVFDKIHRTGYRGRLLILGCSIPVEPIFRWFPDPKKGVIRFGWSFRFKKEKRDWVYSEQCCVCIVKDCDCNEEDKGKYYMYLGVNNNHDADEIHGRERPENNWSCAGIKTIDIWNKAGNITQWRGK